jgi:hypothetical protein
VTNWQRQIALKTRLDHLGPATASALLGLVETATSVAELHQNDARGADIWLKQTAEDQIEHAIEHLRRSYLLDDDGLREASHAACRLAFLFALAPELKP